MSELSLYIFLAGGRARGFCSVRVYARASRPRRSVGTFSGRSAALARPAAHHDEPRDPTQEVIASRGEGSRGRRPLRRKVRYVFAVVKCFLR